MMDKLVEKYDLVKRGDIDGLYSIPHPRNWLILVECTHDYVIHPVSIENSYYRVQADLESINVIYKDQLLYSTSGGRRELIDTILKFRHNTIYIGGTNQILGRGGYTLHLDKDEIYISAVDDRNGPFSLFDIGIKAIDDCNPRTLLTNCNLKEVSDFIYKNKQHIPGVAHMEFIVFDVYGMPFYFPDLNNR